MFLWNRLRAVGAGVSGTLKSSDTRRMLFPFSTVWVTVPGVAFGPFKLWTRYADHWLRAAKAAQLVSVASDRAEVHTSSD